MQPNVPRRLAAILAADVAGFSRLTGADEEGTLARLRALRYELINPAIASNRGRVVKTTGDGILIEFASAVDAMRCAIEAQRGMIARNLGLAPEHRIDFRVGIHIGDCRGRGRGPAGRRRQCRGTARGYRPTRRHLSLRGRLALG